MTREEFLNKHLEIKINVYKTIENLGINIDDFINELEEFYHEDFEDCDDLAIEEFLYDYLDFDDFVEQAKDIMATDVKISLC